MARQRVKWMDYYEAHGRNAALTCRYPSAPLRTCFGISRQTFYRWKRLYNPYHLSSVEERSHRPKRLRQPTLVSGVGPDGAAPVGSNTPGVGGTS